MLEAARLYRVLAACRLSRPAATGSSQYSEAGLMAHQLGQLGVPADRIIREEQSANTRDHALFVPPLLKQHGLEQFVLVTSQQHIARALASFVPSAPTRCRRRPRCMSRAERFLEMVSALAPSASRSKRVA